MDTEDSYNSSNEIPMKNVANGSNKSYKENEETNLVDECHAVSLATAVKLRFATLVVSWISVVVLVILGTVTLVSAIKLDSSAAFAFGLDAFLDCLSSIVVIWRYMGAATTLYSGSKERRACIILGVLFLVSALSIVIRASLSLSGHMHPDSPDLIFILYIVNAVVCFLLMVAKFYLAKRLESISIATDGVNSLIGFILAIGGLVGDQVFQNDPSVWYLDSVIGIVCSLFLLIYGVWLIVYELRNGSKGCEELT